MQDLHRTWGERNERKHPIFISATVSVATLSLLHIWFEMSGSLTQPDLPTALCQHWRNGLAAPIIILV